MKSNTNSILPRAVPSAPCGDTGGTAPVRKPIAVDAVDQVFGGRVSDILPPMKDIPEEFGDDRNPWVKWQSEWFFSGLKRWPVPREGIDVKLAMANLHCVQGSWAPKHEHKMAGVAYLASLWFSSPDGEPIKSKEPA